VSSPADVSLEAIFPGESAMSAAMRAHDWSATALGPPNSWPAGLRVPLAMMLTSRFEMWLGWGDDLAFFYNDAYIRTLGVKHPTALGRPLREVWREIFAELEQRFLSVMRDGVATWDKALMLLLERSGYPEETYHTFSYSPLRGDSGAVEGLMCVVTEETERVVSERRLETLRKLASLLVSARTREEIKQGAHTALQTNRRDFPFALVRFFDEAEAPMTLAAADAELAAVAWPLQEILQGASQVRAPLKGLIDNPPKGDWNIDPREVLLVPIVKTGDDKPGGALVLGLNPYRPNDPEIVSFARLLAGQIAGALATADARLAEAAETERLRQLFEQSPSFMALLRGHEHRFELTNPAYLQLIAHRNVVGKTVREAVPEIEGQGFFELLDQVYSTGEPFIGQSVKINIQRTPGAAPEERFLDFVYQPIRNALGAVSGIFVEGVDVTSARNAIAALRASEEQFRTFAEAAPNHVWTSPPDGGLDWFNIRVYEYSGASPGQLDGGAWASIVHSDDLPGATQRWAASLASGATYEAEFRIRRADGIYRWHIARAVPIRGPDEKITRWIGTNTDIEDQKTTAQALADLNANLEQQIADRTADRNRIWQLSTDIMVIAELDGVVTAVNPAGAAVLGWREGEFIGRNFFDFIHPGDLPQTSFGVRAVSEGSAIGRFENRYQHKDGSFRWITWAAVRGEGRIYAVGRDVSVDKQQAETLRQTEEQLRQSQKMEAIGQLTGGVAHDFNNLLQIISGNLQLLAKEIAGNERAERRVANATVAVGRGSKLASQLLAFGRRQPLEPKAVNIGRLVSGMDELLRRALGESVEIETIVSGGLWNALIDPAQLENAVLNLAINARDAMDGAGRLTIEVGNAFLDDDYARKHAEVAAGQYVVLTVTDTGAGMSPDVMRQVFEPFFSTKPAGKGTGLGMSMVYGFVRQSGGHVKIYSELGQGTAIKLYLPRVRQDEDSTSVVQDGPIRGGSEVVLVAEDDEAVRDTLVEMLEELGYQVLKAKDAASALAVIDSGAAVDLLLTDVVMPGELRSPELARKARQRLPGVGVLFTSGYTENAIVHGGRLDAGVELLAKPYSREALARKVRHVLANRSQRGVGAARAAPPTPVAAPDPRALRILLVEDDLLIRMATADCLRDLGHIAIEAGDAREAIEALRSEAIDVLMTDLQLPGMSGADLAARARETRPDIQIVFATGGDPDRPLLADARLLRKPFSAGDIAAALDPARS
jgi:PAS domain S-box-containing protein